MQRPFVVCMLFVLGVSSCKASGDGSGFGSEAEGGHGAQGGAAGSTLEAGLDVGFSEVEPFTDADPVETKSNGCPGQVQSFIWIANTKEGTLSKVCTTNGEEVARYFTSPQQATGDPSRTSVNLHGDVVVTNRDPSSGPSSVTKIAGDIKDCVDRNNNGVIETSYGAMDVKPWGEDECVLWNTPLGGNAAIGARATAWDGKESPETGLGGHVYLGALINRTVYKIHGETGAIVAQAATGIGHYGGAIDGKGNFWTVAMGCTIGNCTIERISLDNLNDNEVFPIHCGYGISIDAKGRVWTAGQNMMGGGGCVSRFDPSTGQNDYVLTGKMDFNRGVAVGAVLSSGSIWTACTNGDLIQVDPESLEIVRRQSVGTSEMVGVAIDYEGFVWTVSQGGNAAHKIHPATWEVLTVPIGQGPYTYSDMTGMQLRGVVQGPK